MSGGHQALLARRARLVERAAHERDELAVLFEPWERPLRAIDRTVSIFRALKGSPVLRIGVGVAMAALAFIRPRSIFGWVVGGQTIWKVISRFRRES